MSSVSRDSRAVYLFENITYTHVRVVQYIFSRGASRDCCGRFIHSRKPLSHSSRALDALSSNLRVRFNAICSAACVVTAVVVIVVVVVVAVAMRNAK